MKQQQWKFRHLAYLGIFAMIFLLIHYSHHQRSSTPRKHQWAASDLPYSDRPRAEPPRRRRPLSIAILVATKDPTDNYRTAASTMRCYARVQQYHYYLHFTEHHNRPVESDWEWLAIERCISKEDQDAEYGLTGWDGDYFFHRLCIVVEFMAAHPEHDYVLMLDNDVGVVNPQHRIEEFIDEDESVNIYFYEREHAWEISFAGALFKNNAQSRLFLQRLHDMRLELPKQLNSTAEHLRQSVFSNRDNGGLHQLFLELFASKEDREKCEKLILRVNNEYRAYNNWEYQVCVNHFLTNQSTRRLEPYYYYNEAVGCLKVSPPYRGWARDCVKYLGMEKWCLDHDFMLHDWKEKFKDNIEENQFWPNPFNAEPPFGADLCVPEQREEVIQRFWRDRWRSEAMFSKESFDAVVEQRLKSLVEETDAYLSKTYAYLGLVRGGGRVA